MRNSKDTDLADRRKAAADSKAALLTTYRAAKDAAAPEQAARQAKDNGLTLDQEIAQLILHGLIHLCGYDHATDKGEMNRLELRLRRRLGV